MRRLITSSVIGAFCGLVGAICVHFNFGKELAVFVVLFAVTFLAAITYPGI